MNVLFAEKITLFSLLRLLAFGRSLTSILYFDPPTAGALRMLRLFQAVGLIPGAVRQVDRHIGQVRNGSGASEFGNILGRAREICRKIRKERLETDPLIREMASFWAKDKVLLYFDKMVEREVNAECLRMALVQWIMTHEFGTPGSQPYLLIQRKHWLPDLREESRSQGIRLMTYGSAGFLKDVIKRAGQAGVILVRTMKSLAGWVRTSRRTPADRRSAGAERSGTTLAVRYWYRTLRFNPVERSEFFWLNGVSFPTGTILLYDYVSDKPLDPETLREFHSRGIRIMGRAPGVRSWNPSLRVISSMASTAWALLKALSRCLIAGNAVSPYTLGKLALLAMEFTYWHEFFRANEVKAHLGTLNTTVGQVLAMDRLGGVTMAYQYSTSNLFYPTKLLSAGESIQFVFSSAFERLFRDIEAPVEYMVKTGFIYDGAIRELNRRDRAADMRRQLQANGATFILCFFDENSVNRWDILCSDDDAVRDYEYLLSWFLSDPTLGIVFKPKNSMNLFERLAPISHIIEKARETQRCLFLTSDTLYGNIFPAEAALAADICIGKLLGTSAAVEAELAGKPTLLVDTEGLRSHPFHKWGKGRIIFEDWDSLRLAVERYRYEPESNPRLGNWSPELNDLDPFQDGHAGLRMGSYVFWMHEGLKRGLPKQDAMANAAEKYTQQWGESHVTRRNRQEPPSTAS
jgi:hypothetical protein